MYVELTNLLKEDIPNYPESPDEALEPLLRQVDGAVSNTSMIHHFTHNGTHVDAPFHFDKDGRKIDELPINDFIYERPFFLDLPKDKNGLITLDELKSQDLSGADLLLIRTGFDILRVSDPITYRYFFPGLTLEAARYLREELVDLKALIIDFLSVDRFFDGKRDGFDIHLQLLSGDKSEKRPVLIIEDANLEPLTDRKVERVIALPMRFEGADGAPVSIVAEVV